jgi:prepilin-type N-terminal cleavage/methylation domain-containing protein
MIKIKKAFSLIEVIFVLVILGIVASISSQIIVQVYENYIIQKALYATTTKTEIAINQIVNRLTFLIDGTTISKDPLSTIAYTKASENINWIALKDLDITLPNFKRFTTIEWIGYDNDSFSVAQVPYWSGLANYDGSAISKAVFETPGSRLDLANTIISNLSNNKVNLTGANLPAVIFTGVNYLDTNPPIEYNPACMGLIDKNNTNCISRVSMNDNTHFNFPDAKPKSIYELYKLAWSAYALVPEESVTTGLFNLNLYYNYQPWNHETYKDGSKSLLINNVSVLKFTENGGVIQLKLCVTENIGKDYNISSCKEKAIIR